MTSTPNSQSPKGVHANRKMEKHSVPYNLALKIKYFKVANYKMKKIVFQCFVS